jgi:shikimate dehydrogenase
MASTLGFTLTPNVDNYCVMGNPIKHSKSPQIHAMFAAQCRLALHYQAVLVEPEYFTEALSLFQQQGGKGLNVTVPFKVDAWREIKHLSVRAKKAEAVNTIWFDDDGYSHGDNTDGIGLVNDLNANAIRLQDKRVMILGAGGAARGVLASLAGQGLKDLSVVNRTLSKAQELKRLFADEIDIQVCAYDECIDVSPDIIINATSAGLQGQLPPLRAELVAGAICYDMVYASEDTAFVSWAKANGAKLALDGLGMLVEQAAESFYIWTDQRPQTKPVIESLRNHL